MTIEEFENHLRASSYQFVSTVANGTGFILIKGVQITGGSRAGSTCEVGIIRQPGNPWVPHPSVHVRPHLVPMGQRNSQNSQLGADWQYLSRRFDKVSTPKNFLSHILTVLAEL